MADDTQSQQCVRDDVNVCHLCGELENLSVCGACKCVWYCCKSHQREDWKKHKHVCKPIEYNNNVRGGEKNINEKCKASSGGTESHCSVKVKMVENNSGKISASPSSPSPSLKVKVKGNENLSSSTFKVEASTEAVGSVFNERSNNNNGTNNERSFLVNGQRDQSQQQSTKTSHSTVPNEKPKLVKRDDTKSDGRQQRYYLEDTTQTLSLPPSVSELSTTRNKKRISKLDMGREDTISQSREQYLLILQSRFNEVSKYVVKCLMQYGICVVDKFLGEATAQDIFKEVLQLQASGVMNQGQLVNGPSSSSKNKHIRGDEITWVDGTESRCENIHHLISCMDTVMLQGAKSLEHCTINERTKAMVASYPGGGSGYIRHVDNPSSDGRCVTCIYYLNKNWDVKNDGGLLRIFPEGSDQVANIEPVCDRLLFFWSDRRNPHEVDRALRARYAITVWYYDADERAQALKRLKVQKEASRLSSSVSPVNSKT